MTGKWCSSLSLSWTDRLSTISRSGKTDDRLPQEDLAASSNDTTTNGPNFDKIIVDLNTPLYTATTWLVPIAVSFVQHSMKWISKFHSRGLLFFSSEY